MQIGLLSSVGHPFSGLMYEKISQNHSIDCLILDEKNFSSKDLNLWNERTNNRIPFVNTERIKDIDIIKVQNHCNEHVAEIISSRNLDLLVNCGTPRILKSKIIFGPNIGILNCHPGILPFYRGCSCVEWALFNEDKVGNTCHLMTENIDEGPIICVNELNIENLSSYQSIRSKLYMNSIDTIIQSIDLLKTKSKNQFKPKYGGNYYKPIDDEKMKVIFEKYGNDLKNI